MKMFSAYDIQCKDYFNTGRNSETKEKCEESIIDFLLEGECLSDDDEQKLMADKESILECFKVRIDKHEKVI